MRYCETCEVPVGLYDIKGWGRRQVGECPYCGKALSKQDGPVREEWVAVTNVTHIYHVNADRVATAVRQGLVQHRKERGYTYVRVGDCEALWPRHGVGDA